MQCATKAPENAAMRLRFAEEDKAKALNAAGYNLSTASSGVGSRYDTPRSLEDYDLELLYSGESDGDTDLTKAAVKTEPKAAMKDPNK